MCKKDELKNYSSIIYYYCAISIVLIIAGIITWSNVSLLETFFKNNSNYITEIITTSVLAIGVLVYIGNCVAMRMKYRFIELRFGFKEYIITVGSIFLIVIAAIYFWLTQDDLQNVLSYIAKMGILALILGGTIY